MIKPSEKFKFVFNWDLSEDTSRDINPLYNNKLDLRPMFGRGLIGGIDKKEQLKISFFFQIVFYYYWYHSYTVYFDSL